MTLLRRVNMVMWYGSCATNMDSRKYWGLEVTLMGGFHFLQGEREIGISELTSAIDRLGAIGSLIRNAWRHAILAAMLSETGRHQAAAETVTRAIELVETTGEQWAESEVYRIAGEVILRRPDADTRIAEQHLNHAIEVARHQNTRWWELRATTSWPGCLRRPTGATGSPNADRPLRLVHPGFRHRRPEGRQGAARGAKRVGHTEDDCRYTVSSGFFHGIAIAENLHRNPVLFR